MAARLVGLLLGLLVLLPTVSLGQSSTNSTNELVLADIRLVDPSTETVRQGALRIEGERIFAILESAPAEFGGQIIDLDGRWVLPGLVDAHVHLWGNTGPAFQQRQMLQTSGTAKMMLYAGATAFLYLFSPEDYILDLRNEQRAEGLLGADIYAAGPILTWPNGHGTEYDLPTRTVESPADARRTGHSESTRSPDVVKLVYHPYHTERYPSMDRATMKATVEAARARDLPPIVHFTDA